MADTRDRDGNALKASFVFVPHGDPLPLEWMARHPGWAKFPATFVPHPVPRRVVPSRMWDEAGVDGAPGYGPMSRPVSVGAPVVQRRRVPVHRLPTGAGSFGEKDAVAAYRRASEVMDGAASAFLASEWTRGAAPKALSTSIEELPSSLMAEARTGGADEGMAQARAVGGRGSPAAPDVPDLRIGTAAADSAGTVMADARPAGPATARADVPAAPGHIDVAPVGMEHGSTGDAAAVAESG